MLEFPQWISVVNAEEMTVKKFRKQHDSKSGK